jgi:hypothetical protein
MSTCTGVTRGRLLVFGDAVRGRTIAVAVTLLLVAACSDSPGPDTTPPAAVTDLALTGGTDSSLTVIWTAPGDDGSRGQAASYDLRYSLPPLPAGWDTAIAVPGLTSPRRAGLSETVTVESLERRKVYQLALKTTDDAGNVSGLSNVVEAETGDVTPPSRITDLAVTATGPLTATLTWTAPGDNGDDGQAASYLVRYAEAAITDATWGQATVVSVRLTPKPSGEAEELVLTGLPGDRTLWFAIRAVDAAGNQGAVSNSPSGYVRPEARAWEVRVDGTGDAPTIQAGIDSATDGDVVLVHRGTYYEHLDFRGKNVNVRSSDGPQRTVVDGSHSSGSVITFRSKESQEAVLEGFTIMGGTGTFVPDAALVAGGGIFCQNAGPSIIGNIISDNTAGFPARGFGGGLLVDGTRDFHPLASPRIEGNSFLRNRAATNGGALMIGDAEVTITGNLFRDNECRYDGGAVYLAMGQPGTARFLDNQFYSNVAGDHGGAIEAGQLGPGSPPLTVQGNLFVRNEAHGEDLPTDSGTGGAIAMSGWPGTISNNTFVGNVGTGGASCTGGALLITTGDQSVFVDRNIFASSQGCAVACRFGAAGTSLRQNVFWANNPGNVDNPGGCFPYIPTENIFTDPLFCDPAHDNYHVRSDSPALSDTLIIGAYAEPGCSP